VNSPNRVAEGIDPSAPTPPDKRDRIRRFLTAPKDEAALFLCPARHPGRVGRFRATLVGAYGDPQGWRALSTGVMRHVFDIHNEYGRLFAEPVTNANSPLTHILGGEPTVVRPVSVFGQFGLVAPQRGQHRGFGAGVSVGSLP
jgi:hypothetical protein